MQIRFFVRPVPLGDDDVSLDALWPLGRLRGDFTVCNPRGPICELGGCSLRSELGEPADHCVACLSRLYAAQPRLGRRIEVTEQFWNGPRVLVSELVAGFAAIGLD